MNPMVSGFDQAQPGTNLLSILINLAFGFVIGLMIFFGPKDVLEYGSKLAGELIKLTGYGQQMASFGFATAAAPYIVIAPIAGIVLKEISSVRSLKGFAYFAIAVLVGVAVAYFSQGYFATLIS
ncbi:hypothetical protein A3A15_00490 [Candidatus Giovannonibacteria bacterium RIFCSPLOWO2_01_FULL_43_60]|nr:MAG: hypothetical protein A3A15_00490 [Candidatus Giovannonibacteria bacterium RIFCSPLOWO2_01_FULL_43_60]